MKHDFNVVLLLCIMFVAAQIIGLLVLYNSMDVQTVDGNQTVVYGETAIGERPDVYGFDAFIFFAIAIAIGTGLLLFIIYIGKYVVWQLLFLYAVVMTMAISFGVFIGSIEAFVLALLLGVWKVFRPNAVVHNITEVFMYAGIAVLFVPLFNVTWAIALLLLISIYDFVAVFKSRHMVKMAQFQIKGSAFAGLLVKYVPKANLKPKSSKQATQKKESVKTNAILGGGDIVFPLLFAGVVLTETINAGTSPFTALLRAFVIPVFAALFLALLLVKGQRNKFYPAMPAITAGCLIGYGLLMII